MQALTASGDGTAHIWRPEKVTSIGTATGSSEDSGDSESEENENRGQTGGHVSSSSSNVVSVKAPILVLSGHQGVVSGCAWMNEELAVTSSWDRSANLYNVESGALLQTLAGHDRELTHVACHPTQRLVATCSLDSTFRFVV